LSRYDFEELVPTSNSNFLSIVFKQCPSSSVFSVVEREEVAAEVEAEEVRANQEAHHQHHHKLDLFRAIKALPGCLGTSALQ
jgi:hypothetical protein